ncbi:hypothetical protein MMC22_002168 [Lobaria immixta]|nr:hypothetical protein [Lobaria immixta]
MCASGGGFPQNMQCVCIGSRLVCGRSYRWTVQQLISWCQLHCSCAPEPDAEPDERVDKDKATTNLDFVYKVRSGNVVVLPKPNAPKTHTRPSGNNPTGSSHTCAGTCTSVNGGCDRVSNGDCKCFAPPVGLFFWHQGDCGTRLPSKAKRDLAQQRRSYYLNATAKFASTTAPPGRFLPDLAAQLASGLLPSPCNASYVSFACSDSLDGIVHEPPQHWLGALVPEGAETLPPVPEKFLSIHGGKKGNLQVLLPAVG